MGTASPFAVVVLHARSVRYGSPSVASLVAPVIEWLPLDVVSSSQQPPIPTYSVDSSEMDAEKACACGMSLAPGCSALPSDSAHPGVLPTASARPPSASTGAEPAGHPDGALAGSHSARPPTGSTGGGCSDSAEKRQAVSCKKGSPEGEGADSLRNGNSG